MAEKPKSKFLWIEIIGMIIVVLAIVFVLNYNNSQKNVTGNIINKLTENNGEFGKLTEQNSYIEGYTDEYSCSGD